MYSLIPTVQFIIADFILSHSFFKLVEKALKKTSKIFSYRKYTCLDCLLAYHSVFFSWKNQFFFFVFLLFPVFEIIICVYITRKIVYLSCSLSILKAIRRVESMYVRLTWAKQQQHQQQQWA